MERVAIMLPKITKKQQYNKTLKSATVRDFSGGWNVLDDDLNLASKYSVKMFNCYRDANGNVSVRNGASLFAACKTHFEDGVSGVVNAEYFIDRLVVVGQDGSIVRVAANGGVTRIWDNTIAAALPGAPAGWGPTTFASFAIFNGEMIIANGV